MSLSKNAITLLKQRYCHTGEQPKDVYKRVGEALSLGDTRFGNRLQKSMEEGIFLPNSPCIRNAGHKKSLLHACMTKDTVIHTLKGDFTVEKLLNEKDFYVFSCDGKKIKIGKANKIIKTRINEDIYEIKFDVGTSIKLTKDHKVMMRDGSYKKVEELKENDSIMPFNYDYSELYGKKRYRYIYENIDKGRKPAYIFVFKEINGRGVKSKHIIHHKDFNRQNDSPENLDEITGKNHNKIHGKNNIMKTEEMKKHFSEMMIGNKRPCGCKRSQEFKDRVRNWAKNDKSRADKISKALKGIPKSEEHKLKTSQATKKAMWQPEVRKRFLEGVKNRRSYAGVGNPNYNHKVISITYLGKEDVYDIECVEKYHNFAANGIFIHNCFILPVEDSTESIFDTLKNMAIIFHYGGGVGINFSRLRPNGASLSSGGYSSGVLSFMDIFDSTTNSVKQGGFRRGALMGILNFEHAEIIEFIRSKMKDKLTNFNISVLISDKFMEKVVNGEQIELKNPQNDEVWNRISAKDLFDLIAFSAWNTGDPGLLFYDRINKDNKLFPKIKIKATNPCGEVPLPEYGACCLGSINISKFVRGNKFQINEFSKYVEMSTRALLNMNAISWYPLPQITKTMKELNPIGVGIMGFADALIKLGIMYDSDECLKFIDEISKPYIEITNKLAKDSFYKRIIAPTGSLSILADCSSSIEPVFEAVLERHLTVGVIEETRDIYKSKYLRTAHQVSPEWHLKVQSKWQEKLDGACSKTINLPSNASVDDVKNIYLNAWKGGVKGITIFRDGSKQGVLKKVESKRGKCEGDSCHL